MFDPRVIANAVLKFGAARGRPVTNLQMQKIVYFLHGEWLLQTGQPLVTGHFEAWQHGPVHRTLYDAFRLYEDTPIEAEAKKFDPITRRHAALPELRDQEVIRFLDATLPDYIDVPAFILVQRTHAEGTPWTRTMESAETKANVGMVIDNSTIARHFEGRKLKSARKQTVG